MIQPIQVPPIDPLAPQETFSGFYEQCDVYCLSVQLNPDGTFVYWPRIPGIRYPPLPGHYLHLGGGVLFAVTTEQNPPPRVTATHLPGLKGRRVTAHYAVSGVGIPAADVCVGSTSGGWSCAWTDEQGRFKLRYFVPTHTLEVSKCGFDPATIEVTDPHANSFEVWLKEKGPYLRGQLWFVTGGELLILNELPLRPARHP